MSPGRHGSVQEAWPSDGYQEMGEAAIRAALEDAGLPYSAVQQVYTEYVYGDSTCGQAAYRAGTTGADRQRNNNCSTGSTALFRQASRKRVW